MVKAISGRQYPAARLTGPSRKVLERPSGTPKPHFIARHPYLSAPLWLLMSTGGVGGGITFSLAEAPINNESIVKDALSRWETSEKGFLKKWLPPFFAGAAAGAGVGVGASYLFTTSFADLFLSSSPIITMSDSLISNLITFPGLFAGLALIVRALVTRPATKAVRDLYKDPEQRNQLVTELVGKDKKEQEQILKIFGRKERAELRKMLTSFSPATPPAGAAGPGTPPPASESIKPSPAPDFTGDHSYFKVKLIGSGGMAEVWLVETSQKKKMALKILKLAGLIEQLRAKLKPDELLLKTAELILRFEQEFRLGTKMRDGTCQALDTNIYSIFPGLKRAVDRAGFQSGFDMEQLRRASEKQIFIATTFIPKEEGSDEPAPTLTEVIRGGKGEDAAVELILPALRILDSLHKEGIAHRDLKPDNFLVARDQRGKSQPWLIDLGIAKDAATSVKAFATLSSEVLGSQPYMPPYAYSREGKDDKGTVEKSTRIDIFETGIIFYETLTGENPLSNVTEEERRQFRSNPEREMAKYFKMDKLPLSLQPIIGKMLSPYPATNYRTTEEVITAIEGRNAQPGPGGPLSGRSTHTDTVAVDLRSGTKPLPLAERLKTAVASSKDETESILQDINFGRIPIDASEANAVIEALLQVKNTFPILGKAATMAINAITMGEE